MSWFGNYGESPTWLAATDAPAPPSPNNNVAVGKLPIPSNDHNWASPESPTSVASNQYANQYGGYQNNSGGGHSSFDTASTVHSSFSAPAVFENYCASQPALERQIAPPPPERQQPVLSPNSEYKIKNKYATKEANRLFDRICEKEAGKVRQISGGSTASNSNSSGSNGIDTSSPYTPSAVRRELAVASYKERARVAELKSIEAKKHKSSKEIRRAAILRNKIQKLQLSRGMTPDESLNNLNRLVEESRKEVLATSTRHNQQPHTNPARVVMTAEEEIETIADYKCQYDFDLEREAQQKALNLLKEFGM